MAKQLDSNSMNLPVWKYSVRENKLAIDGRLHVGSGNRRFRCFSSALLKDFEFSFALVIIKGNFRFAPEVDVTCFFTIRSFRCD